MKLKRSLSAALIPVCLLLAMPAAGNDRNVLRASFANPPESTKPWCYWYWLNGDVTREGITKDLEAMAGVGINLAMIGNVTLKKKTGPVRMLSQEWMELTRHAMREGARLGVDIYMFNGPGWSQSGGPWITREQSMRRVTSKEFVAGGGAFSRKVRPDHVLPTQDIAVLALPRAKHVSITGVRERNRIVFEQSEPFAARSLMIEGDARGKLFAVLDGERHLVAEIDSKRGNPKTDFLPGGFQNFSFQDTKAARFVFEFQSPKGRKKAPPLKAVLSSEPKVAKVLAKQMGRMHPTPAPNWQSYIFPATVEPADASVLTQRSQIVNLSRLLKPDGVLDCTLPEGDWTILYFGMVPTGKKNHPAPPEATGYEVDKMSREHVRHHFAGQFEGLLKQLSPEERGAFTGITIDSYEVGAQNWTDGFAKEFEKRNGYDPITLLPVFTGRVVDSARTSDRFLWDLRRTVADMISENYVAGLREIAHENDLKLWCENYGHWGFPGDFLSYGGQADELGGEFWVTPRDRGTIECRAASSAAHIYGKQRVYAEAFTNKLHLHTHPYTFKARGEELFAEGINHFVLHVYAHQPRDGTPGNNPWFGTAFHRNTPWFSQSRNWTRYLQRCHLMLQQGEPVADVAVYIGDFAPQMTGPADPVPGGYDYDYIGSDAVLKTLKVADGEWVVYDEQNPERIAARYRLLARPPLERTRGHVEQRLSELEKAGGRIIDTVPVTAATLQAAGIAPIVSDTTCPIRWKARRLDDGMIFFISNFEKEGTFEATLRVAGKAPELWDPVTGEITKLARYKIEGGTTRISIDVKTLSDSCFIVFRDPPAGPSVVAASAPPSALDLSFGQRNQLIAESGRAGTYDLTMSDGSKRRVVIEQPTPAFTIGGPWRETRKDAKGYSVLRETAFELPAEFGQGQPITLDLGAVSVMAKVMLNGKSHDTLWMPPFALDVTDALRPGRNDLQVLITSTSEGKPLIGKTVMLRASTRVVSEDAERAQNR
jgi:hypothetical protein